MADIEVRDGEAYCEKCGTDVPVRERPGDVTSAQLAHVLVGD